MPEIKYAIDNANMFIDQIEYEFSDLIKSYHIGNPRAQGIFNKVNGVKDALKIISEESVKESKPQIIYKTVEKIVEKIVEKEPEPPEPEPELEKTTTTSSLKKSSKK